MAKRKTRSVPDRKISETFLDFTAPLLQGIPSESLERGVQKALEVAFTAWNAVIFADVLDNHSHIDHIRRLTAGEPMVAVIMEQMIARKRALFPDDWRLIGDWDVTRTKDGINLHADARDPRSLPQHSKDKQPLSASSRPFARRVKKQAVLFHGSRLSLNFSMDYRGRRSGHPDTVDKIVAAEFAWWLPMVNPIGTST